MNIHLTSAVFAIPVTLLLSSCATIGQLPCQENQIAKYDGTSWQCAADETGPSNAPTTGIIWLNHHDLVVSPHERITLSTNGTDVFVKPKAGIAFPERELVPVYVSTIPPGFNVTGIRVCYGIVGDQATTKVRRLRLAQFRMDMVGSGTSWPGYLIKMEDSSAAGQAPTPPAGGFSFGDPDGFVCVDSIGSEWQPCLDPGKGTIAATTGVQIGDQDDHLVIQAIGVHYDRSCTPR